MKIFFIGAGPGDPELLTLKAKKIISRSDIIIYAGSLVNKAILKFAPRRAQVYDSSSMSLEDVLRIMKRAKLKKKDVARIHTGDPSIYGAIQEQMAWCDSEGVAYEIIPGVSSLFAAAAALKQELTLPGISQTVIITRLSGRTKVPAGEALKNLARINATLVIFLSVDKIGEAVKNLIFGYDKNTPAAVVYRASWDDEKVITGTLGDIAAKVKREGVKRQALIFVGNVLGKKDFKASELYNKNFSHSYRRAR